MGEQQWSSLQVLKSEYQTSVRKLERYKETLPKQDSDRKIVGEMISDCRYVVEWLSTGRRPGSRRGIERRAAYQREMPMDPFKMQALIKPLYAEGPSGAFGVFDGQAGQSKAGLEQLDQLERILSALSAREKECFTMVHGSFFSLSEAAEMLGISKSSAALYVRRAQKKITAILNQEQILNREQGAGSGSLSHACHLKGRDNTQTYKADGGGGADDSY